MAGVYREVWTGEVLKYLTTADQDSFLQGLPDYSRYVKPVGDEAQAIHLVDMGVLPDVLINNTTYPIPVQALEGQDVVIQLDKYNTKATPITDDELYALSYKKMETVKQRHGLAIQISKVGKAIHALGPSGNTADMPVLHTTGADDGTGRKRLTWDDIADLKAEIDALEISDMGRRLVLSKEHENDLIREDQKFKDQYYNRATGKPYNQLGFDFYSYARNPYYDPATKNKLSYGATPTTHRRATVFFSEERCAKAVGWVKMYFSEAKTDTEYQRNLVNFRHHFIVLPTAEEARGAIVSADAQ